MKQIIRRPGSSKATCFALVNTQIGWECSVCYLSPFAFLFELCLLITHRDGAGWALCQCQKRIEPCRWRSLEMDDWRKKPFLHVCHTKMTKSIIFLLDSSRCVDKTEKGRKTLVDGLFSIYASLPEILKHLPTQWIARLLALSKKLRGWRLESKKILLRFSLFSHVSSL